MQRTLLSISGIVILAGIVLLINSISNAAFSRFFIDLTEENLYSLSPGTKNILASIDQPIKLRFYYSKTDSSRFSAVKLYATRVQDLLKEYDRVGGDKIDLEIHDPRPDSEDEEWAQKYGLTPMQLPTGDRLFLGLAAVNGLGQEEVVPIFNLSRQEFLEYDISKVIVSLSDQSKPKIGIISPLKLQGETPPAQPGMMPQQGTPPWVLVSQLGRLADIDYLGTDIASVADDVDVLMVIHPKNLPEQTRYAIDQYVMKGGKLFVAVDPYCSLDNEAGQPGNPMAGMFADKSSNLPELSTWGVGFMGKKMVADLNLATKVASRQGQQPENFVVWLTLNNADEQSGLVNRDQVVSASLDNVLFPWPGALELTDLEGVEIEPLFQTTKEAMLLEEQDYKFAAQNPTELLRKARRGTESYVLAAKVHGKLKSAFKNKPGAEGDAAMSSEGGHLPEGVDDATIIVVADVDFLADPYSAAVQSFMGTRIVSLLNDNLIFAANSVENLTGSDDLIGLRSRGKFTRPFTKVQEIEAQAQDKWRLEEQRLQAKLNEANTRLTQLQGGGGSQEGEAVFNSAVLEEIKRFRNDRQEAQRKLREVRRNLRQEKEALGTRLFLLNTFGIPLLLIFGTLYYAWRKPKEKLTGGASEPSASDSESTQQDAESPEIAEEKRGGAAE